MPAETMKIPLLSIDADGTFFHVFINESGEYVYELHPALKILVKMYHKKYPECPIFITTGRHQNESLQNLKLAAQRNVEQIHHATIHYIVTELEKNGIQTVVNAWFSPWLDGEQLGKYYEEYLKPFELSVTDTIKQYNHEPNEMNRRLSDYVDQEKSFYEQNGVYFKNKDKNDHIKYILGNFSVQKYIVYHVDDKQAICRAIHEETKNNVFFSASAIYFNSKDPRKAFYKLETTLQLAELVENYKYKFSSNNEDSTSLIQEISEFACYLEITKNKRPHDQLDKKIISKAYRIKHVLNDIQILKNTINQIETFFNRHQQQLETKNYTAMFRNFIEENNVKEFIETDFHGTTYGSLEDINSKLFKLNLLLKQLITALLDESNLPSKEELSNLVGNFQNKLKETRSSTTQTTVYPNPHSYWPTVNTNNKDTSKTQTTAVPRLQH